MNNKKVLELFSGTHSIGRVCKERGIEVVSLDRDLGDTCPFDENYKSLHHIKEDIMTWDYKVFDPKTFYLITASPVCLWWSSLRNSWIGRKSKTINPNGKIVTKEDLERDIQMYGIPMVDKVFEILDYFKPEYFIIENPSTGLMKNYINNLIPYYDVDYCKYSEWGYKKKTRIWTNIENFKPKICKDDCENIIKIDKQKLHAVNLACNCYVKVNNKVIKLHTKELREKYKGYKKIDIKKTHKKVVSSNGGGSNRLERYRIPLGLIRELFNCINLYE